MKVDPFDLSTWHCLDYRSRGSADAPMTRQELALEYVRAETALRTAKHELGAAKLALGIEEAKKTRIEGELEQSLDKHASESDCAKRAIAFADAVGSWRAADQRVTAANDRLAACTKEADRALEALIAPGPSPAP